MNVHEMRIILNKIYNGNVLYESDDTDTLFHEGLITTTKVNCCGEVHPLIILTPLGERVRSNFK